MITLYQFDISPFCDKVRRVLNVKQQAFQTVEISLAETVKGDIRKYSRAGKLPAIDHDGKKVWDSSTIVKYLEETFPENRLIPSDPKEKALVHFFEDWADESLYFYEMHLRFVCKENSAHWSKVVTQEDGTLLKTLAPYLVPFAMSRTTKAQGIGRKSIAEIESDLTEHVNSIADWLGGDDWLVGNRLTLADISVYAQLFCIQGAVEGKRIIERSEPVVKWMERVEEATASPANAAALFQSISESNKQEEAVTNS